MAGPDTAFWQARFEADDTPWERPGVHPQLLSWLEEGALPTVGTVLVPGCGSGREVVALARAGLAVTGLDYAPAAVERTRTRVADAGVTATVELADVLQWQPPAPVDLVYEQTCLCALHPDHWRAYGDQLAAWVKPGGVLAALFMQMLSPRAAEGFISGPPYHSDIHAMRAVLPASHWVWPKPPYPWAALRGPAGELGVLLQRRAG